MRDIYFPAHVYQAVGEYAWLVDGRARVLGPAWADCGLMFPSGRGTPLPRQAYQKGVERVHGRLASAAG